MAPMTSKFRLKHNSAFLMTEWHLSLLSPKEQISSFLSAKTQAGFIGALVQ